MTINLRDALTLLAVVSFGGALYSVNNPAWYGFLAAGLLLYAARDLFGQRKP